MKVRFKRLSSKAVVPKKAHATDAGFDLVATSREVDEHGAVVYGTGMAIEIPAGHVGLLFPRSSIAKKDLVLSNCVGVIDNGYTGEITAKFKPSSRFSGNGRKEMEMYEPGDRIMQLVIFPYPEIEFEETDELTDSERGTGGYGSTGR